VQTATGASEPQEQSAAQFRSPFAMAFLAGGAVLAASFVNLLQYLGYPLLRPETAIVAAGLLGVTLVAALLYRASGRIGRALMEGLLVFLAFDLNLDIFWVALAAGLAVAAVAWRKRMSLLPVLAVFAGIVFLTTLAGLGERRAALEKSPGSAGASGSGPALLHIILDEHVGLQGIADPALRSEMERFYGSRGFRTFDRAYSRHYHTVNAIPDILNFGAPGAPVRYRRAFRAGPTAWLGLLARQGYGIHIYQSEFGDFCSDNPHASCTRYMEFSLEVMRDLPLPASEKARKIAQKFATLSVLASGAAQAYDLFIHVTGLSRRGLPLLDLKRTGGASTLVAMAAFDELTADLRQARRGNAFFAHLLIPHRPFVAGPDCHILPPSAWRIGSIAARGAYHRQLRCVMRKLDAALAALAASPAGADAIVILHGDHGSRLANVAPRADRAERLSAEDLVAGYSTLFAIRAPGLESGPDPRPASAAELLQALARSGFTSAETLRRPGGGRTVMLDDSDWIPRVEIPLPDDWQDPPR
jgi:hypothetical protein